MPADDPNAQNPTPSNYQRTTGGNFRWKPPTVERLQELLFGYEVLEILGMGGMGAVYKARQISLDRMVAIKILPPEAGDVDMNFSDRFRNEARTMAKMNHPAIVSVYDFGETAEGQLYFVMEFIDGTDVAKMILAQGQLPPDYALAITAHLCDALQYAHSHGVIHRDIKPANVLIDREGRVKVADFGLAKATNQENAGLTKTNMAMGTPDFVAPEVLSPGMAVDSRADLYAVGVMLYNMLTGEVPRGMFRLPGQRLGTDPRFDKIITRAMEMDREMRYQTAFDIRRDLDQILAMPRVQAGGESSAAIPKQAVMQKPVAYGPRAPQSKTPTGSPHRPPMAGSHQQAVPDTDEENDQPPQRRGSNFAPIIASAATVFIAIGGFLWWSHPQDHDQPGDGDAATPEQQAKSAAVAGAPNTATGTATSSVSPSSPGTPKPSVVTGPAELAEPKREGGVLHFNGNGYQLMLGNISWFRAKQAAENLGGHLVTITTKDEDDAVRAFFKRHLNGGGDPLESLWIGASRPDAKSEWRWVTGEPFGYANWAPGEPNLQTGMPPWVLTYRDREALWRDDGTTVDGKPLLHKGFIIEWDKTETPGVAAASAPMSGGTAATSKSGIDLLALANLSSDVLQGSWRQGVHALQLQAPEQFAVLQLPYEVPEEYDFEIEFSVVNTAGNVNQLLSVNGRNFAWKLNSHGRVPPLYGFELLDGKFAKDHKEASAIKTMAIEPGKTYVSTIEVRRNSLRALVNGEEFVRWSGDFARFSMENESALRNPRCLGVGSYKRGAIFTRIEVREVAGKGTLLRSTGSAIDLARAPSPTAGSAVPATAAASSVPMSDLERRLSEIDGQFQAAYDREIGKSHAALVDDLTVKYAAALQRATASATHAGLLDDVLQLKSESQRVADKQPLPETDPPNTSVSLKGLRNTYRTALAKLEADSLARAKPFYDRYDQLLEAYQKELTQQQKLDDALKVKSKRDDIATKRTQFLSPQAKPATASSTAASGAHGSQVMKLFDGRSLAGWRVAGPPQTFVVEDGAIKATGKRGNLYFVGEGATPPAFKDFDLSLKAKTDVGANSGVWLHCAPQMVESAELAASLEIQIDNTTDLRKTGSVYGVEDIDKAHAKNGEWFDLRIVVQERDLTVYINGTKANHWRQPTNWTPPAKWPKARLGGGGVIGFQSNGGITWFKDIELKPL